MLIGALGCNSEAEDADLFYPGVSPPSDPVEGQETARLEFVREYGDVEAGLVFGRISVLAASPSEKLAVYDEHGCRIWLIDTPTGDWTTLGGCGEGPGEFQLITAMTFDENTLVVFDLSAMAVVRISMDGEELSRFRFPWKELDAHGVSSLTTTPDGSLLAAVDLIAANYRDRPTHHRQFARLEGTTGTVLETGLTVQPITMQTLNTMPRFAAHCAPSAGLVFVVNVWGPQVMLLRPSDFSAVASVRVPIDWSLVVNDVRFEDDNHLFPRLPPPGAACGDGVSVVGYRRLDQDDEGETMVAAGSIFVLDNDGNLVASIEEPTPPGPKSILRLTPGAGAGDRVFFFTNDFNAYPIVREYKVVRREEVG